MVHAIRAWMCLISLLTALLPISTLSRHILLDKVLSDNPPPGQSDASCAHLVRAGLDEGVDRSGRPYVEPEVKHLTLAMRMMWWECASEIANALARYGAEVEEVFQMEQRSITKSLNQIKSALEKGKPMQSISPAFEWAQSGDWVYINVKMSHKLDAPATLNVVSEGVDIGQRSLKLSALKDQKRFALDLALHADIDPEQSTTSLGSVGRVTFTLKKAQGGTKWPTLLEEGVKKPVNMHVWWAKQEEYTDELEDIEEAAATAALASASGKDNDETAGQEPESTGGKDQEDREKKPLTDEARLDKAQREAVTGLSKEKKARLDELEKEKKEALKVINAEAATKRKEAEEAAKTKKATVEEEFEHLMRKKEAEVEAAFVSTKSEL